MSRDEWLFGWTWEQTFLILDKRAHRVAIENGVEPPESNARVRKGNDSKIKQMFPDAQPDEVYELEPEGGWSVRELARILGGVGR